MGSISLWNVSKCACGCFSVEIMVTYVWCLYGLGVNWDFIWCAYYSTQNCFICYNVWFDSVSYAYNHYCWCKYISKMASYYGFSIHTTTICTKCGNVNAIDNLFETIATVIGILVFFMKYWLKQMLQDIFFVFPLSRMHVDGIHWDMEKFFSHKVLCIVIYNGKWDCWVQGYTNKRGKSDDVEITGYCQKPCSSISIALSVTCYVYYMA